VSEECVICAMDGMNQRLKVGHALLEWYRDNGADLDLRLVFDQYTSSMRADEASLVWPPARQSELHRQQPDQLGSTSPPSATWRNVVRMEKPAHYSGNLQAESVLPTS